MTEEAILIAVAIFALRVLNNAVSTVRLVILNRDRRFLALVLGFIESVIFAVTLGPVVANLSDIPNMVAYAGGYAVGGYLGQWIEARFISSFVTVNIIATERGHELAAALREGGYGVTETLGEGGGGMVTMLRSVVMRQQAATLLQLVNQIHTGAFITVEEARAVHRGWIRAARHQK